MNDASSMPSFNRTVFETAYPYFTFPFGGAGDLIIDQLVPNWREIADVADINFTAFISQPNGQPPTLFQGNSTKPLLLISGGITSVLTEGGHAIAIKIDRINKTILYKDPYGTPAPRKLANWLRSQFPGFAYRDCPTRQQYDNISCSWMRVANVVAWLRGQDIDPLLQGKLDHVKWEFLGAMRSIWPTLKEVAYPPFTPSATSRIRNVRSIVPADPIELSCFRHLKDSPRNIVVRPLKMRIRNIRPISAET